MPKKNPGLQSNIFFLTNRDMIRTTCPSHFMVILKKERIITVQAMRNISSVSVVRLVASFSNPGGASGDGCRDTIEPDGMLKTAVLAFATFFATIGPVDLAGVLAALTPYHTAGERRALAVKAVMIAACILLSFAFSGKALLDYLGISLAALRISGGILLLLLGISMVFGKDAGGPRSSEVETIEAMQKKDISVFPLAMPLIAGPASISASVLLMAGTKGDLLQQAAVITGMMAVLAVTLLLFMAASGVQRLLGVTGLHVISRTVGVVLSALAVQFMLDGIRESGLLK